MDSFAEVRTQASKRTLSGSLQPRSHATGPGEPASVRSTSPHPHSVAPSDRLVGEASSTPEVALVLSGRPTGDPTPSSTEGASQQVPPDPSRKSLPEAASGSLPLGQGSPILCGSSSTLPTSGSPSPSLEGAFTQALEAGSLTLTSAPAPTPPLDLMADLQSLDPSLDWTAVRTRERKDKKLSGGRTNSLTSSSRATSRSRSPIQNDSSDDSRSLSERRHSASPPTKKGKKKSKSKKVSASQAVSQDGGRK